MGFQQGGLFQLSTHPDSGPFRAAPRHFFLKYGSIPAKKCLAQRKNSSLPVTLPIERTRPMLVKNRNLTRNGNGFPCRINLCGRYDWIEEVDDDELLRGG